ncbi:hypothetical protein L21SP5_03874 [Salinivirga cyanobacteriivorans]|uniref:Uncharacterized protein n=1 Tax=Salinivirga cyanobacteriivorans TaxID=1307839 RepID=A0A0S2I5B1_9BACT|nr:DUF5606 domain-containing protein [Salinivirga cyanobacteriivorans]ALO17466.1 hypothetical protein L21SP5_03874 [Salinivirga cyanobacteriivorans]
MLKDILAITGEPGLYKLVSKTPKGVIVENIETGRRMPFYAAAKISALEDIAIFTEDDDLPLKDVFKAISDKENGGPSINHKSSKNELISYFQEVIPDYDEDRVYPNHIKKVINWYNLLQKHDMLDFSEPEPEDEQNENEPGESNEDNQK